MDIEPSGLTEYPLRAFQRDYWEFHTDAPRSPGTHIVFGVDLRGELDRGALGAALTDLRRSHPILRTTYAETGIVVQQRIASADDGSPIPLETVELSPLRVTSLGELVRERSTTAFDLSQGPCWRAILVRDPKDPSHHVVLFDVHHIGWDALSSPIALADLGSAYTAIMQRDASLRPPPEALTYVDLAHALDRYAMTAAGIADREFWRAALVDAPTFRLARRGRMTGNYPRRRVHRPPSVMLSSRGTIPPATMERLERVCEQTQATVFVLCLSALARLLHNISGQPDLCIEMPIAERRYDTRLARSLGPFVHCLTVRATLAEGGGVADTVPAMKKSLDLAMKHRRAPATDFATPHIRRVGINYLKTAPLGFGHTVNFGRGLRAMGFQPAVETDSQYDLFAYIRGPSVSLFGRESLFTQQACDRMLAGYLALLDNA